MAHAVGRGHEHPVGMLRGHERSGGNALGLEPQEEFHPRVVGGLADGREATGEARLVHFTIDGEHVVADGGEALPTAIGIEPEILESESLRRFQVGQHIGLGAVVHFVEGRAQVGDGRRHRLSIDPRADVAQERLAKGVVAPPGVVAEVAQLEDAWPANRLAGPQCRAQGLSPASMRRASLSRCTAALQRPVQPMAVTTPPPGHAHVKKGQASFEERPFSGAKSMRAPGRQGRVERLPVRGSGGAAAQLMEGDRSIRRRRFRRWPDPHLLQRQRFRRLPRLVK
jgi:hypothetical protein